MDKSGIEGDGGEMEMEKRGLLLAVGRGFGHPLNFLTPLKLCCRVKSPEERQKTLRRGNCIWRQTVLPTYSTARRAIASRHEED